MRLEKNKNRYIFYGKVIVNYEGYFKSTSNTCYCIKSVDVGYSKWKSSKVFYI
jgi:hypothetical protein